LVVAGTKIEVSEEEGGLHFFFHPAAVGAAKS
jgi:hypothetical protein